MSTRSYDPPATGAAGGSGAAVADPPVPHASTIVVVRKSFEDSDPTRQFATMLFMRGALVERPSQTRVDQYLRHR